MWTSTEEVRSELSQSRGTVGLAHFRAVVAVSEVERCGWLDAGPVDCLGETCVRQHGDAGTETENYRIHVHLGDEEQLEQLSRDWQHIYTLFTYFEPAARD